MSSAFFKIYSLDFFSISTLARLDNILDDAVLPTTLPL